MRVIGGYSHYLSRRALLAGAAGGALACTRRKGAAFPGYAFVADEAGRTVTAVDLTWFRVARQIGLGAEPSWVIAHPRQPSVYVLTPRSGSVHEIAVDELKIRRSRRVADSAVAMRLAPDGASLWILASGPPALVRLPLDTFRPAGRVRLPAPPADFDLAASPPRAAVSFAGLASLALLRLDPPAIETNLALPAPPSVARFRSDGRLLLAGHPAGRSITVLDASSGKTVVTLPLALEPVNFCFAPNGGQLFVTGPGMDAVAIVYPFRTEVAETLLAGRSPDAMAVTGDSALAFITNPESGEVSVLDVATHRIIAAVAVGAEPRHVVFTPDNQYALVLNRRSGDMAVIRVAAVVDRRTRIAPLFTMIPVGSKPVSAAVRPL